MTCRNWSCGCEAGGSPRNAIACPSCLERRLAACQAEADAADQAEADRWETFGDHLVFVGLGLIVLGAIGWLVAHCPL